MNAATHEVYALVLAAGGSRRLGTPKQLLGWRKRTLLTHSIEQAQAVLPGRVLLVLGSSSDSILKSIDVEAVTPVINPDWQEGIASSIRAGIQALPETAAAVLILLCDQPLVNAFHLQNLLNARQVTPRHIIASLYRESPGVPALFPAKFFAELLTLQGDRGAKPLFKKFADQLLALSLPEAGLDIDCAEDVARLYRDYPGASEV